MEMKLRKSWNPLVHTISDFRGSLEWFAQGNLEYLAGVSYRVYKKILCGYLNVLIFPLNRDILTLNFNGGIFMKNQNTIELLKKCDAGTKMAVASIDEVLDFVHDDNLKNLLTESKEHHETLGNELHSLLLE